MALRVLLAAAWVSCLSLAALAAGPCPDAGPPGKQDLWSVQTAPSPAIRAVADRLRRSTVSESVRAAMVYIVENLAYDSGLNAEQFDRTAEDIFRERTLGGCSEFALALLALTRAMDIPSRLVLTANTVWMEAYKRNPYAIPNGHSLVEVWDGTQWLLADPTGITLYEHHDPCFPCLPGGEIFMARGADFWSLGITTVDQASGLLEAKALGGRPSCSEPVCVARYTANVDFVRAFLNQGTIFYERGKYNLAARLARKAGELSPGNTEALVLRGKALLAEGECVRAREVLEQAVQAGEPGKDVAQGSQTAGKTPAQDGRLRREARELLLRAGECTGKPAH